MLYSDVTEKVLKAPCIKIEDETGFYRPLYRQMNVCDVPMLNSRRVNCPFESASLPYASRSATPHKYLQCIDSHVSPSVWGLVNIYLYCLGLKLPHKVLISQ